MIFNILPLISVVTVTLNNKNKLNRTVRSVLSQDFNGYEYIVKDGGSEDGTLEFLSSFGINNYISQKDTGIYSAMNQAINYCKGEYIIFINAGDEFINQNVLSRVANYINDRKKPDLLYGDVRTLDKNIQDIGPLQRGRLVTYHNRLSPFYLSRRMICHQAWILKNNLYSSISFNEDFYLLADYFLLLKLIMQLKVSYFHIPEAIVFYDRDGITSQSSPELIVEYKKIQELMYTPLELKLYKLFYSMMSFLNRRFFIKFLYPKLNDKIKGIYNGF